MPTTGTPRVDARGRAAFAEAIEPYRSELRLYCYRMCGSFVESEDLLQETLLRAWRGWPAFRGESAVRTWLYRIATNVCLAFLLRRERRVLPFDVTGPVNGTEQNAPLATDRRWLEPIPDRFLSGESGESDPGEQAVRRETIELTFLAALQVLSTRQRAVLVLRGVLGLPADEAARALGISAAAVKSALQRARTAMRAALDADRSTWSPDTSTTEQQRAVARQYVAALEQRDPQAMARLLHADLRVAYPPRELWVSGRDAFIDGSERHAPAGAFRYLETRANAEPAIAVYLCPPGSASYRRISVAVLRVAGGQIIEMIDFSDPQVLDTFDLPEVLAHH